MKTSKISILNYILEHFNYTSPGTNDVYHIYIDEYGKMYHTMQSFEFRGYEQSHIITISLQNEFAPYTKKQLKAQIDYQAEKLDEHTYQYNKD